MWEYESDTGRLYSPTATLMACGYSGRGTGRNNPALEAEHAFGPVPRGLWFMGKPVFGSSLGPCAIPLQWRTVGKVPGGRSAFYIHGDNLKHDASKGCIIMPRSVRDMMSRSTNGYLLVRLSDSDRLTDATPF